MKLAPIQVLSAEDIRQIHEATLDILESAGIKVLSPTMLAFLEGKGLAVDKDKQVVYLSRSCVEDCIAHIPAKFDVFGREGEYALTIGDGTPKVAAGHNAVFWLDSDTGETRPSKVSDVEQFARICDQLCNIDIVGVPVMPQDMPDAMSSLLHGVRACIENTTKPMYFSTDRPDVNRACIELLRAAFKGDLSSQVYGMSQLSPTSPLYWEESVCEAIEDTVRMGIPLSILPEPNAGISAPYTLAGLVTIDNAECISGLVMSQLIRPGAKVLYANSWTVTDMRTGSCLVGSVETTICRVAGAQLAKFYKVPCHTTAPNSDDHAHDEQNAVEKTLSQFCALAAGNDLIVNCGMFATGMTCSHEQLIIDAEISGMARRLTAGMNVTKDTIAADVIKAIGPQGETYMTSDHTMDWLHSDEYFVPCLAVRGPRASWEAAGSKDTYAVAKDKAKELLAKAPPSLTGDRKAKMDEIVANFSR